MYVAAAAAAEGDSGEVAQMEAEIAAAKAEAAELMRKVAAHEAAAGVAGDAEGTPEPGVPGEQQATEVAGAAAEPARRGVSRLDRPLQRDDASEFVTARRQLERTVQRSGDDHAVLLLASPVSPEQADEARAGLGRIIALYCPSSTSYQIH
jgi:hypothetical protein